MRNWKRIMAAVGTAALLISNMGSISQAVMATEDTTWEQTPAEPAAEQSTPAPEAEEAEEAAVAGDSTDTEDTADVDTDTTADGDSVNPDDADVPAEGADGETDADDADDVDEDLADDEEVEDTDADDAADDAETVTYKADSLHIDVEDSDAEITVAYDADAEIPEGASLAAYELTGDEAAEYEQRAAEELGTEITASRFFDVHILDADGNVVQPKTPVTITITYDEPLEVAAGQEIQQVHFKEETTDATDTSDTTSNDGISMADLYEDNSASDTTEVIEVLDVETEGSNDQVETVSFEQGSFSVTGTVVSTSNSGWPYSTGKYVLVVKASDDNYYAVRSVTSGQKGNENYLPAGTLTQVTYNDGKVTFDKMTSAEEVSNYQWEYSTDRNGRDQRHYLKNSGVYIDPTNDEGISSSKTDIYRYSYYNYIYADDDWNYYYLSADVNNGSGELTHSTNYYDAVEVYFASEFVADSTGGTEGGPDEGDKTTDPDDLDLGAPETLKSLVSNEDGTYTLSLSVKGTSQEQKVKPQADIIIVFDQSGSMEEKTSEVKEEDRWGRKTYYTRQELAQEAIKELANELIPTSGEGDIRVGLITFAKTASTVVALTNNRDTFNNAIDGLSTPNEGTNWQAGLKEAQTMLSGAQTDEPDAKKYVIFVSDGNPTYWVKSNGGTGGTGYENNGNIKSSYENASGDAKTLVDNGASFYTLGVFGNVNRMTSLTAYAYSGKDNGTYPEGHYQTANDKASLKKAFTNILKEIDNTYYFKNVVLTDGVTSLTRMVTDDGTVGDFTYTVEKADGAKVDPSQIEPWVESATYDSATGKVTWNLGNNQLEEGTTYTVSFTVWPSQDAYDIVAAVENGLISYGDTTATWNGKSIDWTQFTLDQTTGKISLKTNTEQKVSYSQVKQDSSGTEVVSDPKESNITVEELPCMPLDKADVTIKKVFYDSLEDKLSTDGLSLTLKENNQDYISDLNLKETSTDPVTKEGTAAVAPGLIKVNVTGSYTVLENGHDYTITESGTNSNSWTLSAETYRPMVIGTELKVLRKVASQPTDGSEAYQIEGSWYVVDDAAASTISATNYRKSDLNITKILADVASDKTYDDLFTFNVTVTDANAQNGQIWFSVVNDSGSTVGTSDGLAVSGATLDQSSGYYVATSGTAFTVKIKAGWNLRVLNVSEGTTYSVTEVLGNGYLFKSVAVTKGNQTDTAATISNMTASGSINESNQKYTVTYTNRPGAELPKTGGWGTTGFSLAGLALMGIAFIGYSKRRWL